MYRQLYYYNYLYFYNMEHKIAHIISKSIAHNIQLLKEGYFDEMFNDDEDINTSSIIDNDVINSIQDHTDDLLIKSVQDLRNIHITPLFLSLLNDSQKYELEHTIKKLPKETYNNETQRYEIIYIAKSAITTRKWYWFISQLVTYTNKVEHQWNTTYNITAPNYMYGANGACLRASQIMHSGPRQSIWFLNFAKYNTNKDVSKYIKEHPDLYPNSTQDISKSNKWLSKYLKYLKTNKENKFFNKCIKESSLYESVTTYVKNKGIAITTQFEYAEPEDKIYKYVNELSPVGMYVPYEISDKVQNGNHSWNRTTQIMFRKINVIFKIRFTDEYDFKKEIEELNL